MTNKDKGVLLLSHCGFSFMEDLIEALNARGLRSFVLSSSPLPAVRARRLGELQEKASRMFSVESDILDVRDVDATLVSLHKSGERVLCCISVWEAYRGLMAHANARLGVRDLGLAQIDVLRNKLLVRNRLADAGLSRVTATALDRHTFESLKKSSSRHFVKPICGIASYGAFELRPETQWSDIERLKMESDDDLVYRSAFGEGLSFLAEGYVLGREFSFEIISVDGTAHVLAVHEKYELTEVAGTVLENCCTSPPVSIDAAACSSGIVWVRAVLDQLQLDCGCFHLEARYDGERWDMIEINPRVGGSLISHSTRALNGEAGVLELWLDSLLVCASADPFQQTAWKAHLAELSYRADGAHPAQSATFFRAYFAEPGKIESVGLRPTGRLPVVSQVFFKAGDEIGHASREIFLGQILWTLTLSEQATELPLLSQASREAIEVRYTHDQPRDGNAFASDVLVVQ